MRQRLLGHWHARSLREQRLIMGLAVLMTVWAYFAGLWQPLQNHRAAMIGDIALYDRALAVIGTQAPGRVAVLDDDRPLSVVLTETARTHNLAIRRLQPTGGQISFALEDAPFDTVLPWLAFLEQDLGLRILSLDFARRPAPGVIAVSLSVER